MLERLLQQLVDWVTELSYRKTTRIADEWLGSTVSPRSLHAEGQRRGVEVVFTDPVLAVALLDRLLHHATTLNIRGESYRLRHHRQEGLGVEVESLDEGVSGAGREQVTDDRPPVGGR